MDLAVIARDATETFPRDERFELTRQIRRAAASIPSNIAEGAGRGSDKDFRRFLRIAYGSACELETQVRLAARCAIGDGSELDQVAQRCDRVRALLSGLIKSLD